MANSWKVWEIGSNKHGIFTDADIIQGITGGGEKYYDSKLDILNGEPDIHERMIKALTHLATFCEKKKEAF